MIFLGEPSHGLVDRFRGQTGMKLLGQHRCLAFAATGEESKTLDTLVAAAPQ